MPDRAPEALLMISGKEVHERISSHLAFLECQESLTESARLVFALKDGDWFEQWCLQPDDFKLGSTVECRLGYSGDLNEIFTGEIIGVSPTFGADESSTLKVTCHDIGYQFKRVPAPAIFTAQKYGTMKAVAEAILRKHKVKWLISPETKLANIKMSDDQVLTQTETTDWELLAELAGLIHANLFARGDTIYMVDDAWLLSQQAYGLTFAHRADRDLLKELKAAPLLSFSPNLASAGQRIKVEVIAWSSEDTQGKVYGESKLETLRSVNQIYTDIKVKSEAIETLRIVGKTAKSRGQAEQLALAELQRRADNFVTGQGVIALDSRVRAGQKHWLEPRSLGIFGKQYTGEYMFTGVKHTVDPEKGFRTSFDVRRDGISAL